ncbi:MAG: MFS transporter [Dehalococcoidia bacterium]
MRWFSFAHREPWHAGEQEFPRYRWVIIGQVIAQQQAAPFIFAMLGILLPAMQDDLGFSSVQAGWLGTARSAGNLLVFGASLYLVRFSPIKTFNAFILVLAGALFVGLLAPNFWVLLLSLAVYSVGVSWGQIPMNMVRLQWIPPREGATVMGLLLSANTITQMAGLILLPIAVHHVSWRVIFAGNCLVLVACAIGWLLTAYERVAPSYAAARPGGRGLGSAKTVLRRREFYLLGFATLGGATTFMTFMLFLPTYYTRERDISLQTAGFITAVVQLGGLAVNLAAGMISDRLGRRKPLIWPSGLVLPFLWFLMLAPLPPLGLGMVGFVLGAFAWMPFPIIQTIPLEIPGLSPSDRAVGQALQFTLQTSGQLVAPIAVGAAAAATGSYHTALMPLIVLPVAFAVCMLFFPETGPRGRAARPAEARATTSTEVVSRGE